MRLRPTREKQYHSRLARPKDQQVVAPGLCSFCLHIAVVSLLSWYQTCHPGVIWVTTDLWAVAPDLAFKLPERAFYPPPPPDMKGRGEKLALTRTEKTPDTVVDSAVSRSEALNEAVPLRAHFPSRDTYAGSGRTPPSEEAPISTVPASIEHVTSADGPDRKASEGTKEHPILPGALPQPPRPPLDATSFPAAPPPKDAAQNPKDPPLLTPTVHADSPSASRAEKAASHLPPMPQHSALPLPPKGIPSQPEGDIEVTMRGAAIARGEIRVDVLYNDYPRSRHQKGLTREESNAVIRLHPTLVKTMDDTLHVVIETAADGVYEFRVAASEEAIEGTSSVTIHGKSNHKSVTNLGKKRTAGGNAMVTVLMPEGLIWEVESSFDGTIEDGESITKYKAETGLLWKRYR